jgi:hypothetical protein
MATVRAVEGALVDRQRVLAAVGVVRALVQRVAQQGEMLQLVMLAVLLARMVMWTMEALIWCCMK